MSELVERLAKKWEDAYTEKSSIKADTRWWINALADELDNALPLVVAKRLGDENAIRHDHGHSANWLRTQSVEHTPEVAS